MEAKTEDNYGQGALTLTYSQFNPPLVETYPTSALKKRSVVQPGAIIRGDKVRPNPWNYSLQSWTMGDCRYTRQTQSDVTASYSGPTGASLFTVLPDHFGRQMDICYNNALTKFNEKVNGTLNLTVDVIQASQTAGMVNAANRLVEHARKLKRFLKDPRHWRDFARQTGSVYLEWQYGWYPAVQTIYGMLDQLGGDGGSWVRPIRTGNVQRCTLPTQIPVSTFGLTHMYTVTGKADIRCSLWGRVKLSGSDPQKVASLNPAVIAWELLPLSFVADWVIDIGSYLSNMEAASKNAPQWDYGYYSITSKVEANCTTTDTAGVYREFFGSFGTSYTSMSRILLPQYPTPRPPQVDINLGANRMLAAGSLLSQLLKSIRYF